MNIGKSINNPLYFYVSNITSSVRNTTIDSTDSQVRRIVDQNIWAKIGHSINPSVFISIRDSIRIIVRSKHNK